MTDMTSERRVSRMQSAEDVALAFTGECEPAGLGLCANHKAPLGEGKTCLHVLHLTELIRARDAEMRSEMDRLRVENDNLRTGAKSFVRQIDRLTNGIKALTENYRNHYEMHGAAGDDYVVEDGRCVDVDDLLALLNPTEGETDGPA